MASSRSPTALPIRSRPRASIASASQSFTAAWIATAFARQLSQERADARAALGISDGEILISAVGALEQRKGHRYLIEAIGALAADRVASSNVLIAGQGSIHEVLQGEIAVIRSLERIKLLGRVDDARELLWASDIFAMPSLKEGLGVAALEAMASGLPVIASDVGGLREVVEDGRSGIIVPPANSEEIASAIRRLAESAGLRTQMGAAARARVVENYSMEKMAARTLALYRECVRKTREERGGRVHEKYDWIRQGYRRA